MDEPRQARRTRTGGKARGFMQAASGVMLSVAVALLTVSAVQAAPKTQDAPQAPRVQPVDRVVAVVDDDVVVQSELEVELAKVAYQLKAKGVELPPKDVLVRQVLEKLINSRVQVAAATRAGIQVTDEMLNQALEQLAKKNNISVDRMRKAVESDGLSFRSFTDQIRGQLMIQALLEREVVRRTRVSDREVEAFLANQAGGTGRRTAYHLRHLLVAVPEGASPEQIQGAQDKALGLVKQLRGGASFQALAAANSGGAQALEGGDLGWREANRLPTLFTDLVDRMDRGAISDPIRSPSGFHIVQLIDYKGGASAGAAAGGASMVTQTNARHILIRTSEVTSDDDARHRLEQLRSRIVGGDDFGDLARANSEDAGTAIRGGDLGWVSSGDVVAAFQEEMNRLQPNAISQPFRTEFGWHLVQVLERRQHDSGDEARKNAARTAIGQKKAEEEAELYLRRLRDEAYVKIMLSGE